MLEKLGFDDRQVKTDRKSVVQGKSVDLGGRRIIKKKKRREERNREGRRKRKKKDKQDYKNK